MINVFFAIALLALIAASINDMRKREVADWINYALLTVLLASMLIYSIVLWDFSYFAKAALFSIAFYALGSILYYSKMIGGGDVKLITALGPIFNFLNVFNFITLLLLASGAYGLVYSIILGAINRKKLFKELKFKWIYLLAVTSLFLGIIFHWTIILLASIILLIPGIIMFVVAIEKVALIKTFNASKLTEGDWLLKTIKVKGKVIMAKAEGLTKEDIALIKKAKIKVTIKEGIPYVPVFLITFLLSLNLDIFSIILKAFL